MNRTARTSDGSLIWIAGLVVVVLLGVVAVLVARGSSDGDEPSTPQTGDVETPATEGEPGEVPLPRFERTDGDPAVGMTIPTVSGTTLDGEELTIEADGTAKVIVFLAHWCSHCQAEVPRLVEHLAETPMPDDVELVGVSTNVDPKAPNYPPSEWLEREGWTAPTLADSDSSEIAAAYGVSSFPFFVVADADGKVLARTVGEITMDQFDQLVALAQTG